MLARSLNSLDKLVIVSELESTDENSRHRKRFLNVTNGVLLDILAYPELRSVVLNHPICSTWVTPHIPRSEIALFTSREKSLFLDSERDIPDDDSTLYMALDL
jgi:hypothetical protein